MLLWKQNEFMILVFKTHLHIANGAKTEDLLICLLILMNIISYVWIGNERCLQYVDTH